VHGADALSGVVNLRLRTFAEGERLLAGRLVADTRGGAGASTTFGTGWRDGGVLASGGYFESGDLTEGSDLERWQALGRVEKALGGIGLSTFALHARTERQGFPEDSGGPRLAVVRDREQRQTKLTVAGVSLSRPGQRAWRPRLTVGWLQQDDDATTPPIAPGPIIGGVPAISADSRFRRLEVTVENRISRGPRAEAALGATYLREAGEATGAIDVGVPLPADFEVEREVLGAFAEATARPAKWAVATVGLRYDDPSSASSQWTARAALRVQPFEDGTALFAAWSEGYKLPSLYALAYPIIANPSLKPERSESYELGFETLWAAGRGRARVTYFHSRYQNLIDFDPEAFTNVNRSRVIARGVEAEFATPLSPTLTLVGNVTYLDTAQPANTPPLRSRPEWQGLAALAWRPTERLQFDVSAEYLSDFFDSSVPTGLIRLDGRAEFTAAAKYRLSDAATLLLTARNLLSEDYEDAVGFPAPGLLLRASLIVQAW
jgi:vitamin B12 transporter